MAPDPRYPFLSDINGQHHKHDHNRILRYLAIQLRDELGYRVKPAEIQMVGADETLSLRARGALWDAVFIDEKGIKWGLELKRLTDDLGRELRDL